jgi:hypothetical protein
VVLRERDLVEQKKIILCFFIYLFMYDFSGFVKTDLIIYF